MLSDRACRLPATVALVIASVFAAAALPAAVIEVPADQPTIQTAIVAAQPGDEVLVAPGIYFEQVDFLGKAIAVRSTGGPAVTTIDGQFLDSVVTFASGEGPGSVLEGFTIRYGQVFSIDVDDGGGGIHIFGASPVVRGNIIRNNISTWNGAGVFCAGSNALFEDNQFLDNSFQAAIADAPYGAGGGIYVFGGAVTLVGNRFSGNMGSDRGGAICFRATLGSTATDTICEGNSSGVGGAIAVDFGSNVLFENLLAVGNTAVGHVSLIGVSEGLGGGLYLAGTSIVQVHGATVVDNACFPGFDGPGTGGGIFADAIMTSPMTIADCIVRGNTAGASPQVTGPTTLAIVYSDIEGGAPGIGNFDADPLFVAGPLGSHYLSQVASGQAADSPCVDAGDPGAIALPGTTTRTDHAADAGVIDVGFHFSLGAPLFRRGDCNADDTTNIADAVFALSVLFPPPPGPAPAVACDDACDANDDGALDIADAIAILGALFGVPPAPLPAPTGACGADPTADALGCGAGC